MQATPLNTMRKREELKAERNLLFKRFLRNPLDTGLALKIKIIDDQVAAFAEQMELERKAELSSLRFRPCTRLEVEIRSPGKRNPMTHEGLMRRIGLVEYWKLCRKINEEAGAPPHAHAESSEEMKQCPECQEWQRNFEAIWERVFRPLLKEDRPNPGTLRGTQFVL